MKRILLRSIPDPHNEADRLEYRSTIEAVIRMPQNRQTGVTIDEMRRGVRVLDALDAARGNVLELEDADWQHLCDKVQSMAWAVVDRRVLRFVDDILSASDNVEAPNPDGLVIAESVGV